MRLHSIPAMPARIFRKMTPEPAEKNPRKPDDVRWYALRDLKRPNAKRPAYIELSEQKFEVFTPMRWTLAVRGGKTERRRAPVLQDLLFVHGRFSEIEPAVRRIRTLQFRYSRGGYLKPTIIPEDDMNRFIRAVRASESPKYYLPGELTPEMTGRTVRIIGGPLDGYEGRLLKIRGSRIRRLIVELPGLLTAGIEVSPEFIRFADDE